MCTVLPQYVSSSITPLVVVANLIQLLTFTFSPPTNDTTSPTQAFDCAAGDASCAVNFAVVPQLCDSAAMISGGTCPGWVSSEREHRSSQAAARN
jgi:hypothetical protein